MTKRHTINDLAIGTEIYYTGDMANQSGFGVVSAHRPATRWSKETADLKLDDGREINAIGPHMFDASLGRRFVLRTEYETERAEKIASAMAEYEAISTSRRAAGR